MPLPKILFIKKPRLNRQGLIKFFVITPQVQGSISSESAIGLRVVTLS
jgi:hypothetical protein